MPVSIIMPTFFFLLPKTEQKMYAKKYLKIPFISITFHPNDIFKCEYVFLEHMVRHVHRTLEYPVKDFDLLIVVKVTTAVSFNTNRIIGIQLNKY